MTRSAYNYAVPLPHYSIIYQAIIQYCCSEHYEELFLKARMFELLSNVHQINSIKCGKSTETVEILHFCCLFTICDCFIKCLKCTHVMT